MFLGLHVTKSLIFQMLFQLFIFLQENHWFSFFSFFARFGPAGRAGSHHHNHIAAIHSGPCRVATALHRCIAIAPHHIRDVWTLLRRVCGRTGHWGMGTFKTRAHWGKKTRHAPPALQTMQSPQSSHRRHRGHRSHRSNRSRRSRSSRRSNRSRRSHRRR